MRRWQKISLAVVGGVFGAGLLTVAALQVPAVQQRILGSVLKVASQETDTRIELKGTHGFFPWSLEADHLRVSRKRAPLLEIEGLSVNWSPLSLLRKQIVVDEVTAQKVSIWQPAPEPDASPEPFKMPDLKTLPRVKVGSVVVTAIDFYAPEANEPERFQFDGGFELATDWQVIKVDLRSLDRQEEKIQLSLRHSLQSDKLELSADLLLSEEGLAGEFLQAAEIPEARVNLSGAGPASDWGGHLVFDLGEQLQGDLDLHCACDQSWALALKGSLDGRELKPVDDVAGNDAPLEIDAVIAGTRFAPQLVLQQGRFAKGAARLTANGRVDLAPTGGERLIFDLSAALEGAENAALRDYLPLRVATTNAVLHKDGRLTLPAARLTTDFGRVDVADFERAVDGSLQGQIKADLETSQIPVEQIRSQQLGRTVFAGEVALSASAVLSIQKGSLKADGPGLTASLSGTYDIRSENVTLTSEARLAKPVVVNGREVSLKGPLRISGSAQGFGEDGTASLKAELPSSTVDGQPAPPFLLDAQVEGLTVPTKAVASLKSQGATAWLAKLDAALRWGGAAQGECRGTLTLTAEGDDFSGDVEGCLKGSERLTEASATLSARRLRFVDNTVGELKADVEWSDRDAGLSFGGSAQAQDLNLGGILIAESSTSLRGAQSDEGLTLDVMQGQVALREASYKLAQPIRLASKDGTLDIPLISIATESPGFGTGSLNVREVHINEAIAFNATFENVPLVALPAMANGKTSLTLKPEGATGDADLTLTSRPDGAPPTRLFLKSKWRGGTVSGSADIAFDGEEAGREQFATWSVPLRVTRHESKWVANVGDATANVTYAGPIDPIIALFPVYSHQVSGDLTLDGNLKMQSGRPDWQGKAQLSGASYAFARGGVALDHLTVSLSAQGRGIKSSGQIEVLQDIPASNGNGAASRRLDGKGTLRFNSIEDWQVAVNANLNNSPLIHHAYMQGRASGNLDLTANHEAADLKGHVSFNELNIQIPPPGPAEVIPLKIVPVDAEGNPIVVAEARNATSWLPGLNLDVTLEADDRLYLTGRGINTEWKAKGELKGPAKAAAVSSSMQVVRGTIDFGGRSFEVERGSFQLIKGDVDGALIDLQAKYAAAGGTTARILVSGTVSSPKIGFSSSPALPEEEIVALVLFGKPLAELGPLEVLRTGTAIAQVSGRGGFSSGGLLTRMRQSLGIDYLSIDPQGGDNETPVVTAGKYIGKGVFLKVIQGIGQLTGALSLEYALTDEITLSTEVDETFQSEASVEWKRDY